MEGEPRSKRVDRSILTVVLSALIAVSSVIFLILLSFILFLIHYSNVLSGIDDLTFFLYGGIVFSAALLSLSILVLFRGLRGMSVTYGMQENNEYEVEDALKYLDEGEREIVRILIDAGGSMLQRDIARSGNFSRATVTRILDRLESKGVVERLRHGTTNKIVLKKVSVK
jgi:uncharacterized membrane protein